MSRENSNTFRRYTTGENKVWKQHIAIEQASKDENLIIFANEVDAKGRRFYTVMTAEELWNVHKNKPSASRNVHEVIREGVPSKLYFDIEFKTQLNPDCNGDNMVETFIELVCWGLKNKFNVDCSITDVIWLTSSTKEKFSAHLIFQLENHAFKNNVEAGNFFFYLRHVVRSQKDDDDSARPSKEKLKHLIIKDDKNMEDIFCDIAVYQKNKNFRLFLSTKFGKNVPLVLSKRNRYHRNLDGDWMKQLFMDSLVTHFRRKDNLKLLEFQDDYRPKPKGRSKKSTISAITLDKKSNYPIADKFVKWLISRHVEMNVGTIFRVNEFKERGMLIYHIVGYRYCENIKREHKSNNIMIILDMKKKVYYQKCHDPECRAMDFKSEKLQLPQVVLKSYCDILESQTLLETSVTEEEEIDLMNIAAQLEKKLNLD